MFDNNPPVGLKKNELHVWAGSPVWHRSYWAGKTCMIKDTNPRVFTNMELSWEEQGLKPPVFVQSKPSQAAQALHYAVSNGMGVGCNIL